MSEEANRDVLARYSMSSGTVLFVSVGWCTVEHMFEKREYVPNGVAQMTPGPILAAFLSSVDRSRLKGYDLVSVMQAQDRQVAHDQAELMATMAEVAYCPPGGPASGVDRDDEPSEFASDEIRAALSLTRRAAESELDLALVLRQRLPQVWEVLHRGDIDIRRTTANSTALAVRSRGLGCHKPSKALNVSTVCNRHASTPLWCGTSRSAGEWA